MDEEPLHNKPRSSQSCLTGPHDEYAAIDEVHVMRKTVIDGSNTTGFQRTTIIALDGWIK